MKIKTVFAPFLFSGVRPKLMRFSIENLLKINNSKTCEMTMIDVLGMWKT